jgi:hypothetical protein
MIDETLKNMSGYFEKSIFTRYTFNNTFFKSK